VTGYVLFFAASGALIAASIGMLFTRHFVRSVVLLALCLIIFGGLFALLDATFLGLLQLLVYAGAATMVLVFVVMLSRPKVAAYSSLLQPQTALAAVAVVVVAVPLVSSLLTLAGTLPVPSPHAATTRDLAVALMGRYAAPFELASVVLLAALVGAVYLAREAE
jgi:NADH-quinone oxidoreductase subunit J